MVKDQLGKVFVSHSTQDKPFVRRLVKRLEKEGFTTWLDEKELKPGDPLGAEIAKALSRARVVLVVVSPASVRSKWLRYELNLATGRMVKGQSRVVPIVIGDVEPPSEVAGLLYADSRSKFSLGFRAVLTALQYEKGRMERDAEFYLRADRAVEQAFGGLSYISTVGGYKGENWEAVSISIASNDDQKETSVYYDSVSDHGKKKEPLDEAWFSSFVEAVDRTGERLSLVLTERPVGFQADRPFAEHPRIAHRKRSPWGTEGHAVFVEMNNLADEEWSEVLREARRFLEQIAAKDIAP